MLDDPAVGQVRIAAVEYANVIHAEEAALEYTIAVFIFLVHPPGEVEQQLVKDLFQKLAIAHGIFHERLRFVYAPRSPRVHGRIDIAERPLVSRHLPVGVHVPLLGEQQQLLLGKFRIYHGEGNGMKRQIPRCIPRVLPFVRHRNDVGIVEVLPVPVAAVFARGRWGRLVRVTVQPHVNVVVIKLFAPQQAGQRLAVDERIAFLLHLALQHGVKRIRFRLPLLPQLGERPKGLGMILPAQP